jgi:Cyclic nucleotide-binding domain
VLAGLEGGLARAFHQVQAALLPWLARTPDELTSANTAACGLVAVAAVLLTGVRPLASHAPPQAAGRGLLVGPLAVLLVRGKRVARSFAAGVAGWGVPMILLAFAHAPYWPYLMFGAIGVANVFDDVGVYSSPQQVIPPRLMGRALGVRRGVLLLSMGLGSAVTPLLIDAWGARGTLIATGLLPVVSAAVYLPRLTAIDGRISAPGPDLALLRQVPFFRPLPFAIVEHLASELQSATYEPGDVIIREGEPGDRFYIIAAGRARAAKEGKQLREMGEGESFGEIALLRRIPRTATVTALSRLEARILAREEFLAAVTGSPEAWKTRRKSSRPG